MKKLKTFKIGTFNSLADASEHNKKHRAGNPAPKDSPRTYGVKKRSLKKSGKRPFQAFYTQEVGSEE